MAKAKKRTAPLNRAGPAALHLETNLEPRAISPARDESLDGLLEVPALLQKVPMCRKTLGAHVKAGRIPAIKIGHRVMFHWPTVLQALLRLQRASE